MKTKIQKALILQENEKILSLISYKEMFENWKIMKREGKHFLCTSCDFPVFFSLKLIYRSFGL